MLNLDLKYLWTDQEPLEKQLYKVIYRYQHGSDGQFTIFKFYNYTIIFAPSYVDLKTKIEKVELFKKPG